MGCNEHCEHWWPVLSVQPQIWGTRHLRKMSNSANSSGSQGQGVGGTGRGRQPVTKQMSTPTHATASAAPETATDPRRGASWSGRATSTSCQKNSICRCPAEMADCKEGRTDGAGVGARLLGRVRLLSFRLPHGEPRWDPCPRAAQDAWGADIRMWDIDSCITHCCPEASIPSIPASHRAHWLCPTLTHSHTLSAHSRCPSQAAGARAGAEG